jgi:multiple sugar transport system ATP-binding protein
METTGGVLWPVPAAGGKEGQAVAYGIRPEDIELAAAGADGVVPAAIVVVEPTGSETELLVQAGDSQLTLVTHGRPKVNPGDHIGLAINPAKVHLFDQASGARLAA